LEIIRDNVSEHSFKTWFEPIKPVRILDSVLTIQVPSQFFYEWLEEHYVNLLHKTIKREMGVDGRLEYNIVMDNSGGQPITVNLPAHTIKKQSPRSYRTPKCGVKHQKSVCYSRIEKAEHRISVEFFSNLRFVG